VVSQTGSICRKSSIKKPISIIYLPQLPIKKFWPKTTDQAKPADKITPMNISSFYDNPMGLSNFNLS
jgi:hypothetical protein